MHSYVAVSGLDTSLVFGDQSVTENILMLLATVSDVVSWLGSRNPREDFSRPPSWLCSSRFLKYKFVRRYSRLSRNVVLKSPYNWRVLSFHISVRGNSPNSEHTFSRLAHIRTCGKVWLTHIGWRHQMRVNQTPYKHARNDRDIESNAPRNLGLLCAKVHQILGEYREPIEFEIKMILPFQYSSFRSDEFPLMLIWF